MEAPPAHRLRILLLPILLFLPIRAFRRIPRFLRSLSLPRTTPLPHSHQPLTTLSSRFSTRPRVNSRLPDMSNLPITYRPVHLLHHRFLISKHLPTLQCRHSLHHQLFILPMDMVVRRITYRQAHGRNRWARWGERPSWSTYDVVLTSRKKHAHNRVVAAMM